MQSIVSVVKCPDYDPVRVAEAVGKALELAGLDPVSHAGAEVLLKPNLLSARRPDEAVTTHPALVRALGHVALAVGCRVSLGDSPPFAGENPAKYSRLLDRTGMSEVARELGIPTVRFEDEVISLPNPDGRYYRNFEVAAAVTRGDTLINIPKLKTHGLTTFSGAVKNIFGCIPGIRKGLFHVRAAEDREVFGQMLVDLLRAIRPGVNVMDAVVGMEGEGPNAGVPRQVGLIIASADPVALDAVACEIVGIRPLSIHTTRLAHEQGLGCGDLGLIDVRGECIDSVRIDSFRQSSGANQWEKIPGPLRGMLRRQLVAIPRIRSTECIGCGDCARVCPVNAIAPGRPPVIDMDKCIRCYCCHEVCNLSAIDLKRGLLGEVATRLMRKK